MSTQTSTKDSSLIIVSQLVSRVSYRGGGAWNSPPLSHNFPYPEILKLSMVIILAIYMLLNISTVIKMFGNFVPDCNLRGI